MSRLILPSRFTTQPQYSAQLDLSNPLVGRLRYASRLGSTYDHVTKSNGVLVNNPPSIVTPKGAGRQFVNASSTYIDLSAVPPKDVAGWPITVVCWMNPDAAFTAASRLAYSFNWASCSALLATDTIASNVWSANSSSQDGSNGYARQTTGWHHNATVFTSGQFYVYENGNLGSLTSLAGSYTSPAAGNHSIGARENSEALNFRYWDGSIQDLYIFEGALTPQEIKSLYQNHYQIFKAPPKPLFSSAGGSGSVTGTGNITPSDQTATASGTVVISATASITPAAQTRSATGTVAISATASITPAAETVTAASAVAIAATASISPAAQTRSATGTVAIGSTASISPAAETVTASGTVSAAGTVTGTASITPVAQTVTAVASVAIGATASLSPVAQTVAGVASISITGAANLTQLEQTLASSGIVTSGLVGSSNLAQAAQTLSAAGSVTGGSGSIFDPEYIISHRFRPFKVSAPFRQFRINS